jgi:hypothetical protein
MYGFAVGENVVARVIEESGPVQSKQEKVFDLVWVNAAVIGGQHVDCDRLACARGAGGNDRGTTMCRRIGALGAILVCDLVDQLITEVPLN